ncbi:MAG: esterase family protein, partial [Bacteroidaceae bacterium]|nr:esterase family protein [Bacteroidaceae bacterium]
MKKTVIAALSLLLCLPLAAGRIVTDTVKSKILSSDVVMNVYLPDGFGKNEAQRYPAIYLLHGLSDDYRAWRDKGQMQTVVDELIGSGECVPVVIFMPNAGGPDTHNTWNGYFNMPGWNYEDFFFQEFMPEVEKKYKVVGDKEYRAVMGLSMGGGGSTVYCQRHPDMFSSCYAMSPWLDNESNSVGPGGEKDKRYYVCEAVKEHSALRFVEQADDETKAKLRTVKWFFDCGDDDFLFDQSVKLHQLMRAAWIHDELRIRNGVHNWEYWHQALRLALPFASRNFGK